MRVLLVTPTETDAQPIVPAWLEVDPGAELDVCPIGRSGPDFLASVQSVAPVAFGPAARATDDPGPVTVFLDAVSLMTESGSTAAVGRALAAIAARFAPQLVEGQESAPGLAVHGTGASDQPRHIRVVVATGSVPAPHTGMPDGGAGVLAALADTVVAVGSTADRSADLVRDAGTTVTAPIADPDVLRAARSAVVGLDLVAAVADDTPLLGLTGLSARQRDHGLDPATAERQERALADYARTLTPVARQWLPQPSNHNVTGPAPLALLGHAHSHGADSARPETLPGAGTGGGLGYALALLGARLVPAAEVVADVVGLDERLAQADVVVAWTPHLGADEMTHGVAHLCAERAAASGVPVVVLTHEAQPGRREWSAAGISAVYEVGPDLAARVRAVARTWSGV